jgi:DNA-binding MarR family transcriptional regulator
MSRSEELAAIAKLSEILDGLAPDERERVLSWASSAYAVTPTAASPGVSLRSTDNAALMTDVGNLFERASPGGTQDRILVAAYWLQVLQGTDDFGSQKVNDLLKDLGHPVANITKELSRLMNRSPQLVRQTEKSGRTQQARKRYRLTDAGRKAVDELLAR